MSEGFGNPIIGGLETLIRSAIKSVNYVLGVAGWRVSRDGSAELNDAVIRGSVSAGNGNVLLNASGLNIHSTTFGKQSDINSNAQFLARFFPDDGQSYAQMVMASALEGGIFQLNTTPSISGIAINPGTIRTSKVDSLTDVTPRLSIIGLSVTGNAIPSIIMSGGDNATNTSEINLQSDVVRIFDVMKFNVYGTDAGRGYATGGGTTTTTAAIGNTESNWYTIPAFTYKANRVYQFVVQGLWTASAAPNRPFARLRKHNGSNNPPTGVQLGVNNPAVVTVGQQASMGWTGSFQVGGSDVNTQLVVSLQGSAAFNVTGLGGSQACIDLFDITDVDTYTQGGTRVGTIPTLT